MPRPKLQATCHPEEPHCARGLCRRCYGRVHKPNLSPEAKAKRAEYNRAYQHRAREEQPERFAEYRRTRRDEANVATEKWRRANPEKVKQSTHASTLRQYGLTAAAYAEMLRAQGGGCKICGGNNGRRRLAVDHCHETGAVRGLLCSGCNYAVGWAERRDQKAVDALRAYVADAGALKRKRAA